MGRLDRDNSELNLVVWAVALKTADTLARMRREHLVDLMTKHSALTQSCEDLTLWQAVKAENEAAAKSDAKLPDDLPLKT